MNTVLIAEDHADTAALLERMLRFAGYEAVAVPTGSEALRLLTLRVPLAIVLDCHMPDISGLEVLRIIRADPMTGQVPVIMYTANSDDDCRDEAMRLGANDFLVKGATPWDAVVAAVRRHAGEPRI